MKTYKETLSEYIPETSVDSVFFRLDKHHVRLVISRKRVTKLGDYRPPINQKFHRISINHDLNKFQFLITLIHELAHLETWLNYKNRVKPHGLEWKSAFKNLMGEYMDNGIFPSDVKDALKLYFTKITSSDTNLSRVLKKYDEETDETTLEELPENAVFAIYNGIVFRKQKRLRKRYRCKRIDNGKIYMVSPLMVVHPIDDDKN
ncbi:MAG: sprT domain-containing protein [Bacteroidetes bacterium]|nr:MAG: sprT domain-containing protein [Bacteroidota bacterium]